MSSTQRFFVGSYTRPTPTAAPQGVTTCSLDTRSGALHAQHVFSDVVNPSYLALAPQQARLYAVKECLADARPAVYSFSLTAEGVPKLSHSVSVPGDGPCHLGFSPSGRALVVATYGSGHVVLYSDDEAGVLQERQSVRHPSYEHPSREPHAHQAVFGPDGVTLFVPDLGLDEIRSYRLGADRLEIAAVTKLPTGSGPRHLAFHPSGEYAFVVREHDSTLTLVRHQGGVLVPLGSVPLLPHPGGKNAAAAVRVAPSGRFIYASNRDLQGAGNDGIAVFRFDAPSETLTRTSFTPSGGHLPRDFALTPDGRLLVAAHQGSDRLVSFWVDEASGALTPTGETLELYQPVCVLMVP